MTEKIDIPHFANARMVVYGDLMLDRYWYGQTSRISPEAPVPVVCVNEAEARPGGAANVALNLAALGCSVALMGLVGQDKEGDELENMLAGKRITCHFQHLADYPTVTKLRVLGQNQQLLRLDFEKRLEKYDDEQLLQSYERQLINANAVVLSDYAKGTLFNVSQLIQKARQLAVPVFVDPKSNDFRRYQGATLITPNLKEFEAVVGVCMNDEELTQKAQGLMQHFNFEAILVTRGKQGMILIRKNQPVVNLSAHAREVYDVTGAGDTVISLMAASVAAGNDFVTAAVIANLAAGLVVRKLGAASVTVHELRRELQLYNDSHVGVLTEQELLLAVADAHAHDETVVMTNGCFDMLHAGHVEYLEAAKSLGDRLIVAVNDDQSVRRLKGEERPLTPLAARMEVLAALRAVDWVVPFSEDTPIRLIGKVLPDILVKGNDYQLNQIAGSDAVINHGGRVLTLPLKSGFSTSQIINKIKGVLV